MSKPTPNLHGEAPNGENHRDEDEDTDNRHL